MERCFIVTSESEFYKEYKKYESLVLEQKKFVKEFLIGKGIEGTKYIVSGDGFVNVPFEERNKSEITLSIEPTNNDISNFNTMLNKSSIHHGFRSFRKSSIISKEFAQKCIDGKVIINIDHPRIGDYFDSLGFHGYRLGLFYINDLFYLKIESEFLGKDDTPKGFNEIKLSEYYQAREELEEKGRC